MSRLRQIAESMGIEFPRFLRDLADSGEKIEALSLRYGINQAIFYREWNRHGIKKRSAKAFEFLGVVDTLEGHCRELGVCTKHVRTLACQRRITTADALSAVLERQARREARLLGKAA